MNEKQAQEQGYRFTGIYTRYIEDTKIRAKEIRAKGYKAVTVTVPDSPYSRGTIGRGYSVYAEKRYGWDKSIVILEKRLSNIGMEKMRAWERYQKELEEIIADKLRIEKQLIDLKIKIDLERGEV